MSKRASASRRAPGAPRGGAQRAPAGGVAPVSVAVNALTPGASGVSAPSVAAPPPAGEAAFEGQYRVQLESFEGPLDLLLHLIQQHEIDILDIPVSFITEKYLAYLHLMKTLSIDLASEYLVMAATLVHIKSKMLLPSVPAGQEDDSILTEEEDPRAELVRRLLEYQKYKAAAAALAERGTLGRDVFMRGVPEAEPEGPAPFAPLGVFSLLDALEKVLKRSNIRIDHEVVFDRISITDRIVELTERLSERRSMRFEELLVVQPGGPPPTRFDLIITFLAVLEMARLKLIKVYQSDPLAPIHVEFGGRRAQDDSNPFESAAEEEPAPTENKTAEALPENPVAPPVAPPVDAEPREEVMPVQAESARDESSVSAIDEDGSQVRGERDGDGEAQREAEEQPGSSSPDGGHDGD